MIVDKAVWVMERNADQPLNLEDLARACGVSRSHLANAFATATGGSAIRYLRQRRLSQAAARLAEGAPDILTVAIESGYGSHAAFTRAFQGAFDRTPEQVREGASIERLPLTPPRPLGRDAAIPLPAPRIEQAEPVTAVGLSVDVDFDAFSKIPGHWRRFVERMDEIDDPLERMPIGVCHPADETGRFVYTAAVEVARFGSRPQGLVRIDLPARRCAVFDHAGHVSTIFQTYTAIWNQALPENGLTLAEGPVIERHDPAFDPDTGEGGLTLWVPVETAEAAG
jgi:AraC family transcriptional regulator